jgi:hypothetical protein
MSQKGYRIEQSGNPVMLHAGLLEMDRDTRMNGWHDGDGHKAPDRFICSGYHGLDRETKWDREQDEVRYVSIKFVRVMAKYWRLTNQILAERHRLRWNVAGCPPPSTGKGRITEQD